MDVGLRWHAMSVEEIEKTLNTDIARGLTSTNAHYRLEKYGRNVLTTEKKSSPIGIFFKQFANILILILLIATTFSAYLGEIIDAIAIVVIIIFVVILGFFQEYRAEKAFVALKKMLSPVCNARRDGTTIALPVSEIVPGDIVILNAGDKVPADARLVEKIDLKADESPLTGESIPVEKTLDSLAEEIQFADRTNMVFTGTTIVHGRGSAVVTLTGNNTEFGKIAQAIRTVVSEKTPLERRMSEIGKKLGVMVLAIIAIVMIVEFLQELLINGYLDIELVAQVLLFSIALAVAAVPEALPAVVTANLAIGMRILAKQNALARKMHAVETLGCTQIICSDKTGTLTKGEMTVRRLYFDGRYCDVSGAGYESQGKLTIDGKLVDEIDLKTIRRIASTASRCNDASLERVEGKRVVKGDPTEGALLVLGEKLGLRQNDLNEMYRRVSEIPFSSERKLMTTVDSTMDGVYRVNMKGATEMVLKCCTKTLENGLVVELSEVGRKRIREINDEMASNGLRVLAIADRILPVGFSFSNKSAIEKDLVFLGLIGMMDPPRPEAIDSIRVAKNVGIKTIMITGDHKLTAMAIAKELEIFSPGDLALTGEELELLNDKDFQKVVGAVTVYARVSPSHKLRIVAAWQKQGRVVAMTGDGVNDAPALKSADIGIAMGITGTDIAKEASDIVLADDNFATIVKAVESGRWIYDNIKKYLTFLLQANLVEIAVLCIGMLFVLRFFGFEGEDVIPLLPIQILYINLATDGLPALALSFSPPDPDVMKRPPRTKDESVFTYEVKLFLIITLIVETPILLVAFMSALPDGIDAARTRLFLLFIFIELMIAINCSSLKYTINRVRPHKWLLITVIWEIILIMIILAIAPAREALHMNIPTIVDIAWVIGGMLTTLFLIEAMKRYLLPSEGKESSCRGVIA